MGDSSRRGVRRSLLAASGLLAATAVGVIGPSSPAGASEVVILPPSGSVTVYGHGNGHGHGMSQWGAQGAAKRGLTAAQIVSFYYPGTAAGSAGGSIRVGLSAGGSTEVSGATAVTGYATALSASRHYRLVPSGAKFTVQALWSTGWGNLLPAPQPPVTVASPANFSSSAGFVRLWRTDRQSVDYRGTVGAVRVGAGQATVNTVTLENYVRGVVPRESPAWFEPAALQAQAIAARTYALSVSQPASAPYDICDTTNCQVYGGMARYDSSGTRVVGEETSTNDAAAQTAGQIRTYGGAAAFTQFSASSGGWAADGGKPYLPAHPDLYDNAASGDPMVNWTETARVADLASSYGLRRVSQVEVTARDGHGEWGGRVLTAAVYGVDGSGAGRRVETTGEELRWALGLPSDWFRIAGTALPPGSGATTVSSTGSSVQMFYRAANGAMYEREYVNGSGWRPTRGLGTPPGGLSWDPDATTWGQGHIDLVSRTATGRLAIRSYSPGAGWGAWQVNRARLSSSPSAASAAVGSLDIYFRGPGNTLWTVYWTSARGWHGPSRVPGVTDAASGPAAIGYLGMHEINVVYRAVNGTLRYVTKHADGRWTGPFRVNPGNPMPQPAAALDPAVDDTGRGAPSIYYTGVDNVIYHTSFLGDRGWSRWDAIPGSAGTTSAPEVSHEGLRHVDLVAGFNGFLRIASWNAGRGWSSWSALQ